MRHLKIPSVKTENTIATISVIAICLIVFVTGNNDAARTLGLLDIAHSTFSHGSTSHLISNLFLLVVSGVIATKNNKRYFIPSIIGGYIGIAAFIVIVGHTVLGLSGFAYSAIAYSASPVWSVFMWIYSIYQMLFPPVEGVAHVAHVASATVGMVFCLYREFLLNRNN